MIQPPSPPACPVPAPPLAPLPNIGRPVANSTGENTPNCWKNPTRLVNGSALAVSAAAYAAPAEPSDCANAEWKCPDAALSA